MQKDTWAKKGYIENNQYQFNILIIVHLHHLVFNAGHGLYEEESLISNRFEVNLDISFLKDDEVKKIEDTIDYGKVYEKLKMLMNEPVDLLEVLAQNIVSSVHEMDNRIKNIKITIFKCHPPLSNFEGRVGVTLEKQF